MSGAGVPIEIKRNPQSSRHPEKISLTAGGTTSVDEIREPSVQAWVALQRKITQIDEEREKALNAYILKSDPNFVPSEHIQDQHRHLYNEFDTVFPEYLDRTVELEKEAIIARKERYSFADGQNQTNDLHVGKEGTLVYSIVSGANAASELRRETTSAKEVYAITAERAAKTGYKIGAEYSEKYLAGDQPKVQDIIAALERAETVADLHQIEVLPSAQGKGIARALLEVAYLEMAETSRADFVVARVLDKNPSRKNIMRLFEKDGFDKIYCPGDTPPWGEGGYYLLVKKLA